jgi:hypothetical protein
VQKVPLPNSGYLLVRGYYDIKTQDRRAGAVDDRNETRFETRFRGCFMGVSGRRRAARANPAQSFQHCSILGHLGRIGFGLMLSTGSSNLTGAEKKNAFRRTASGPLPVVNANTEPVFK